MLRHTMLAKILYRSVRGSLAAALVVAGMMALMSAQGLLAQTVATYNFDDGTADGWVSFNGATTPTATTAAAYTGQYSLMTTTGATGQGGPSISLSGVLQAGAQYTITGYVELAPGSTASNANFTIRRLDPGCSGGTCYDTIGAYETGVTSGSWVQIGGSYTVSATETGLTLYAQLVGAKTAETMYLDDVVITETAPPPGGTPVASYNFSDGNVDGWVPFGSASLSNAMPSLPDPNGDTHALLWKVTATNGSAGPAYNTQIESFTLHQLRGRRCSPVVTPPGGSYPVLLGDIPASGIATAAFTINFSGCAPDARFEAIAPWSSAVYHTGVLYDRPDDKDHHDGFFDGQRGDDPQDGDQPDGGPDDNQRR